MEARIRSLAPRVYAMLLALVCLWVSPSPAPAAERVTRIMKCQDSAGRWYYGDDAAQACAEQKSVTELSPTGVRRREISAAPTAAELHAREQARQEADDAHRIREAQIVRDRQLVATFASEQDITEARDRRVADIEMTIRVSQETVAHLREEIANLEKEAKLAASRHRTIKTPAPEKSSEEIGQVQSRIVNYERYLESRRTEQAEVRKQAELDLARFREIKGIAPPPAAALRHQ